MTLSCDTWDLVSGPGIEPGHLALGARSPSHWILGNRLLSFFFFFNSLFLQKAASGTNPATCSLPFPNVCFRPTGLNCSAWGLLLQWELTTHTGKVLWISGPALFIGYPGWCFFLEDFTRVFTRYCLKRLWGTGFGVKKPQCKVWLYHSLSYVTLGRYLAYWTLGFFLCKEITMCVCEKSSYHRKYS